MSNAVRWPCNFPPIKGGSDVSRTGLHEKFNVWTAVAPWRYNRVIIKTKISCIGGLPYFLNRGSSLKLVIRQNEKVRNKKIKNATTLSRSREYFNFSFVQLETANSNTLLQDPERQFYCSYTEERGSSCNKNINLKMG